MLRGRPTKRTPEVVAELIERQAHGEPLARICADAHMPSFKAVWEWERDHEDFRNLSAHARRLGTHYMAGDCIRIADDPELEPSDKRVRIETRLRLIGKWNAKDYGDKVAVTGGSETDAPVAHNVTIRFVAPKDDPS